MNKVNTIIVSLYCVPKKLHLTFLADASEKLKITSKMWYN